MNLLLCVALPFLQLFEQGCVNTTLGREVGQVVTGRGPSP